MRTITYILLFSVSANLLFSACGGKKKNQEEVHKLDKQLSMIDSLEQKTRAKKYVPIDKALAEKLIVEYTRFTDSFPQHNKTPEYLFRLSELYYGQRQFKYQTQTLRTIIENYPDYTKIDFCYYMLAHMLDSEYDERTEAKKFYLALLEKYPRSEFAADVEMRLKTIDSLSFNQLIESIGNKQPE